ncbi:MAG: DUF4416 family protein [Dehalococcoidia bacterium]|nr:DUF4416 family protein [Dehalococcoidia bacterium]
MGEIRDPQPVKYFVGVLTAIPGSLAELRRVLEQRFGRVDSESGLLDFTYTKYYEPEMGPGLVRKFWGFGPLGRPDALVDLKLFTNEVEQVRAVDGRRTVNVDPGYLTAARLVLASTKDFAHRLYLGKGIYGEVTLIFRNREFHPLPWTYPDYRSEGYLRYFRELRRIYLAQLVSG